MKQQLTVKLRLCDQHAAELSRQARAVSYVWNYLNEAQRHMLRWDRWLSVYDLMRLTAGVGKELDIHADTVQRVCRAYVEARHAQRKAWLRWRGRKSLGWVPFNTGHLSFDGQYFNFRGVRYQTRHLRDLLTPRMKIGAGSFNQDAHGWYLNLPIEVACANQAPTTRVGIDLGLKELAGLSDGRKIQARQLFRECEARLAKLQRGRKTKRARAIHVKIANHRKDLLHKVSSELSQQFGLIVVGNVSPKQLAKTRLAKSVLDAGWADLKRMLAYKAIMHGGSTLEVSEAYTTQVCSNCGALAASRPKGIAHLRIRDWTCSNCGSVHDRDVNAARNILRIGLDTLVGGTHG